MDPSHGHSIGGGSYWQKGYAKLLQITRSVIGDDSIVVTESNAEPYMADLNAYLTLSAFDYPPADTVKSVPAFPAIYGGYYVSFGRVFGPDDFSGNAFLFVAKLAHMFVYGTQLGWFSLSDSIGIFSQLINDTYSDQRNYLVLLCKYKMISSNFLLDGLLMRPVEPLTSIPIQSSYPVIMHSVWMYDQTLAIFATNADSNSHVFNFGIDVTQYGFSPGTYNLYQVTLNGTTLIKQFSTSFQYSSVINALDVLLLTIQ